MKHIPDAINESKPSKLEVIAIILHDAYWFLAFLLFMWFLIHYGSRIANWISANWFFVNMCSEVSP